MGDRVVALPEYKAWTELVAVPKTAVFVIPENMSYLDAVAITLNYTIAYILLFDLAQLTPGKSLFLHNAGGGVVSIAIWPEPTSIKLTNSLDSIFIRVKNQVAPYFYTSQLLRLSFQFQLWFAKEKEINFDTKYKLSVLQEGEKKGLPLSSRQMVKRVIRL